MVTLTGFSQKVSIDYNTGLVKVNGVNSFYLVPNKIAVFKKDYILQNLNQEELAYLRVAFLFDYNASDYNNQRKLAFYLTFKETGNNCFISNLGLNTKVFLAKEIAKAKLVVNNRINPDAEKRFINHYAGNIIKDPSSVYLANVKNAVIPEVNADNVQIKEKNILYNNEVVGFYKQTVDSSLQDGSKKSFEVFNIYSKDQTKIAIAKHENNNPSADWIINMIADDKKITVLYNAEKPLQHLFKYLIEKNVL
jgi:hypothetical protein